MRFTYLTSAMLAERLNYSTRHVREYVTKHSLIEGYHYVRAPGGRKLLYIWERIEETLGQTDTDLPRIPLASGGFVHG